MPTKEDEFLARLQAAFAVEAAEHLAAMSAGLLKLEQNPADPAPLVETVFREAHSLKGAARAVNHEAIESLCQALETVFAQWKGGEFQAAPALFDSLLRAVDAIEKLLAGEKLNVASLAAQLTRAVISGNDATITGNEATIPSNDVTIPRNDATIPLPNGVRERPDETKERPPAKPEKPIVGETVRLATAKLDALLLQSEELLALKLAAAQRSADLKHAQSEAEKWDKKWAALAAEIRELRRANEIGAALPASDLEKIGEFLEWNHGHWKTLQSQIAEISRAAQADLRTTGASIDNLLNDAKALLMLPFSTLLVPFPKMVRDLSRDQNKAVHLQISGAEIESDKRILEAIKDPLVHLLRNAIDHGIESSDERKKREKPERATIILAVSRTGEGKIEVLLKDDGAGLNAEKLKAAAQKQGVLSAEDAANLDEAGVANLIFQSGVSSSQIITEISGRGLGMAIVREKIERLGGKVAVSSKAGEGTEFRLTIPAALAAFRGLLVKSGGQIFVLPLVAVERVLAVMEAEIETVSNRATLRLERANGPQIVPLVSLAAVLGLASTPKSAKIHAVVLSLGETAIAFEVEEVLNEQEVLVKPLAPPLVRVKHIAGATVLGSGAVVAILNPADLMSGAQNAGHATRSAIEETGGDSLQSVLVAEDSITSRLLLRNILESAGYRVETAVDGQDALTALRAGEFSIVVSDVDMPRLNGLDLTAKIRENPKWAELPIILVTARETREDRERGIEVGANAYLVKSSFDQTSLLDAVRRLV